jgi:hypothetical protein
LGSLWGQQLHIDGERGQVADAANLCTKELRKQAKAIWDAKNTLDDQVNDLVMAYRKHDLDVKRANSDQAAVYCKSLHREFEMLTTESKEVGKKMKELEKSEIGRKSAKLLAKMMGKRGVAIHLGWRRSGVARRGMTFIFPCFRCCI